MSKNKVNCEKCGKTFHSDEALSFHVRAKHPITEEPKKSKSYKGLFLGIGIIVLIVIVAIVMLSDSGSSGEYDTFAQCLTDSGVKMYGAYWCPHCEDQKKDFGKSFDKINYIECSLPNRGGQNAECNAAGIKSYPTWELGDGKRVLGGKSLQDLAQLSGCELVKDTK